MDFRLKTLTPIWTAGVERGRMDHVHETAIVGTLRWWYEAMLRALGRDVCNPTSDYPNERCPRSDKDYCDICRLFGSTGRSRRFRLRIEGGVGLSQGGNVPLPSGRLHNNRVGGWYLQGESRVGDLILRIVPLGPESEVRNLQVPLALIHRHAALGAKVSNGYGVVEITDESGTPTLVAATLLDQFANSAGNGQSGDLPDLRDFFFAKLRFQEPSNAPNWWQNILGIAKAFSGQVTDQSRTRRVFRNTQQHNEAKNTLRTLVQEHRVVPLSPAVRNWLRYIWFPSRFRPGRIESYLFGQTRRNDNIASKINVSHAYRLDSGDWEFRIWGCIPCAMPADLSLDRDSFLKDLKELLSGPKTNWTSVFGPGSALRPALIEWHSLDCNEWDGVAYLKELLGLMDRAGGS